MEIFREYTFHAAHRLPNVPDGHKCGRLHGHTYRVKVYVSGDVDAARGWIVDFADIDKQVRPVVEQLDHRYLNDIDGLDNPTSEHLARWLWERLADRMPSRWLLVSKIVVRESCTSGCVYDGS